MEGKPVKDRFEGATLSRPDHACRRLLHARLDEYRTGPEEDRWPDAVRPVDEAFADARAFIECLPLSSIPVPEISLADDGEINFLWAGDDAGAYVDLSGSTVRGRTPVSRAAGMDGACAEKTSRRRKGCPARS